AAGRRAAGRAFPGRRAGRDWDVMGARWAAGTCAVLFVVLTAMVKIHWMPLANADADTIEDLSRIVATRSWPVDAAEVLSMLFAPFILRLAALVVVAVLWLRASPPWGGRPRGLGRLDPAGVRWSALFIGITIGIGGLLSTATKIIIARARPPVAEAFAPAHGMSFPSGHVIGVTVAAMVGLAVLAAVRGQRPPVAVTAVTALAVVAVGCARLILAVHYLSDVIAGYLLAVAWAASMTALFTQRICRKRPVDGAVDGSEPPLQGQPAQRPGGQAQSPHCSDTAANSNPLDWQQEPPEQPRGSQQIHPQTKPRALSSHWGRWRVRLR
ncbi:phosphatase PAP2 family protein, partial [Frankia sp. Cj3]|uniref:phosphatase PAP2 family protein n=1 Tax=Frankia sp. Cj3 TaxID=2880976 RepID=UPI001EF4D470